MKIGKIAAKYLLDQNCDEYLYVSRSDCGRISDLRYASFKEYLWENGIKSKRLVYEKGDLGFSKELLQVLNDKKKANGKTGIFAYSDLICFRLCSILEALGIGHATNEMPIISCDNNTVLLQEISPRPAIIDTHPVQMALRATDALLWRIKYNHSNAMRAIIEPELIKPGLDK